MDSSGLFSFPLPMLTALLCAVLAVLVFRLELGARRASAMLALVFALGAVQAFLVGLRFGYGNTALTSVQRMLPLFLGPTLYLGFAALTLEGRRYRLALAWHISGPLVVVAIFFFLVADLRMLDWIIAASYLVYIVALWLLWRRGPDALTHARFELAGSLANWMLRGIALLSFLLVLDTAIAIDFALNGGANAARLISVGTVPLVLVLLLIIATLPRVVQRPVVQSAAPPNTTDAQAAEIEAKLTDLMTTERLYLDPELTVQRLAKRLHVPARSLSATINRKTGKNVSQYVNTFRLEHAAHLLLNDTRSVKAVAAASGFLTRSNFYREFQRVYGMSPTEYRNSS